jgi:hypothetical protein
VLRADTRPTPFLMYRFRLPSDILNVRSCSSPFGYTVSSLPNHVVVGRELAGRCIREARARLQSLFVSF